jgi:putative lipoic acid-binding regulatory protein
MTEEDLEKLRLRLIESVSFPSVYMFKFIVPGEHRMIALIENLFGAETDIHTKESRNGRYISITAKQVVMGPDEIISIYRKASAIKGVMLL